MVKNLLALLPSSALYVEKESIERIYLAKRGYASLGIDGELFTSIDKGKNWADISNGLPLNEYPSYVDADDRGPDTAWVTFASCQAGKKIYETRDGGKTWTNISYNLPNLPANCVAYQADRNNNLYVGMDLGIYRLDRKNEKWELYAESFPNVIVSELEVHLADFKLKAATFGRGIWEADLEGVPDIIGVEEVLADQLEMNAFHDEMNNQLALELIGKHAKPLNLLVVVVTGRIVLNNSIQPNQNRLTLNTRNWLPGMYYVTVSNGKTRISKGVVVE
ncbi:MAG: T9SS type A sorting domain-containing protein [Bacteroidetes bacterium]|nr:T9SS type A sorting domain-containing protein [Bacteroidota bacterium]